VDVDLRPSSPLWHGEEIPVVLINGVKRFKGRVDRERLSGFSPRPAGCGRHEAWA
jgi:hypothetical protein